MEPVGQEFGDAAAAVERLVAADADQYKIVHIAGVVRHLQLAFCEMIHRIEINQAEQLAQQVADRYSGRLIPLGKQHNHLDQTAVFDLALDQSLQNRAVQAVVVATNIHLQDVTIPWCELQCSLDVVGGGVRPLASAAGEALVDERAVK